MFKSVHELIHIVALILVHPLVKYEIFSMWIAEFGAISCFSLHQHRCLRFENKAVLLFLYVRVRFPARLMRLARRFNTDEEEGTGHLRSMFSIVTFFDAQ